MTDDNGLKLLEKEVTNAPNAVGPNIEFAIAPVGLIRVAVATNILMSAFYCDSEAARIMGRQFLEMADKLDAAHEEMKRIKESLEVADTVEQDDTIQVVEATGTVEVDADEFEAVLNDESTDPVLS